MPSAADDECACPAGTHSEGTVDACTTAPAGYYTVDTNDDPVTSAAVGVKQAQKGYYTVNGGGAATNFGAVNEASVGAGYYACDDTTDNDGTGVEAGAIAQCDCPSGYFSLGSVEKCTAAQEGYYAVDSGGNAVSVNAVNEAMASAGYYSCKTGDTDGAGENEGTTENEAFITGECIDASARDDVGRACSPRACVPSRACTLAPLRLAMLVGFTIRRATFVSPPV